MNQVDDNGSDESNDIASKIETLENQFDDIRTQTINDLSTKPDITVNRLLDTLNLPPSLKKEYEPSIAKHIPSMSTGTKINKLFILLNPLTSFIDYQLIEHIVRNFGNDSLRKDMQSYCSEMTEFMKKTTIKQLMNYFPGQSQIPPNISLIEAKIDEDASKCTVEQLNMIVRRYCSEVRLSENVFRLMAVVESNSPNFLVRWLVPSALVSDIMKSARNITHSFYQEYKITSLTLDGMWLFLSDAEIDVLWSRIHVSDTKFKDQLHAMYKQIVYELKINKSEHRLSWYFQSLNYQQHISDHLSKTFLKEELPISYLDLRVLATIILMFGSNCLKRVVRSYSNYISIFTKQSTAQQLINVPNVQSKHSEHFRIVECRIMEDPSHYRLEKLLRFQTGFCMIANIDEVCFVMDKVNTETSGSFTVSWLVPSVLISDIIIQSIRNILQSFYQEYEITSLTLDGMWLFLSEAEIDVMWSQVHVSDSKFKDQFHTMYKQIISELEMHEVSEDQLSKYLMDQQPTLRSNVGIFSSPLSLVSFRVLIFIIEKFGSDCLKKVMDSYCNYGMSLCRQWSTAQQVLALTPIPSIPSKYFKIAECRINIEKPSDYGLKQLLRFQSRFCTSVNITKLCFVMGEMNTEINRSFTVRWLVPAALVSYIKNSACDIEQKVYQEYKITSFTIDKMWLYLNETEIDAMWSQMHVCDAKFQDQFHTMYRQILFELELGGKSKHDFPLYLMDQQPNLQSNAISQLSAAFLEQSFPLTLVDFRVLTIIIEKFGSDYLKRVMKSYCNYIMSVYAKQSTAQQLVELSPVQSKRSEYFTTAECRIMKEPSQYTLEQLFRFQTEFCTIANLNKICFIMGEINTQWSGSFTVSWHVPSALISEIMTSASNIKQCHFQRYKITSFTLDAMWLYASKSELDAMWSRMHINDVKFKHQFHTMYKQIVHELQVREIPHYRLSLSLMHELPKLKRSVVIHVSQAFMKYDFPLSLIDFRVLTIIIETFGSDCLKRVMRSYCNYMTVYKEQSTAQQLIDLPIVQSKPSKYFVTAECKVMEDPSHCTLEELFHFQTKLSTVFNLSKICFVMGEVKSDMSGSFTVSWIILSALISEMMTSVSDIRWGLFQEYKITSFTLDAMWLYTNEFELDAMWSRIHVSDTQFKDQFYTIYKQIVYELSTANISKDKLSSYLTDQRPKLQSFASVLSEMFQKFNFPLSLVDFRILTIIVERFGSDCLKRVMKSYCNYMSIHTNQLTAQQLIVSPSVQTETKPSKCFVTVECRIIGDPSDYRAENLLNFKTKLCTIVNIDELCFILSAVNEKRGNSFIIRWLLLSNLAFDVLKLANKTELFQDFNIASLHLGSRWLYHYLLAPLGAELKEKYQQSQGSPSPFEWIPSPTNKIFRLAIIQRERVQRGHIEDRFVQMTISGRVDDILHAKSPVEIENIFRDTLHGSEIILIEGAPGSGKSTLTVHICQRWGKGEFFQQFTVVILVQLRDPAVQRAQTIADLLPVESAAVAQEIATELLATNGRGILWVLDGWDELPPHLQQDSIFRKFLPPKPMDYKDRLLHECSVVVTSRPISSGDLHPVVSSRIEVLGFTSEEQRQYFSECLKGDAKALEALLEKIQENPVVQSICYLPLNAAFIVHTFKYKGQSLPNTEYEIYLSVILSCIQRHFEREGRGHDLPRELASLNDPSQSEAVREPFQCLCKLAYCGVMENKVTFSSSDLPQGSNTLSLLQVVESFLQSGKSVFYNFLHLSIQEVLSAYYLATWLSDSKQVSRFQQLFNQPRFAAVFQFYAAITKLKSPGIRQVIARIVEAKSKPLLLSLLHCLHEAQDSSLCIYVAERLDYRLDLSEISISPLDCLCVSFFLSSLSDKNVIVSLRQCCIGDLGTNYLMKFLSSIDHISKVAIDLSGSKLNGEGATYVTRMVYFIEHLYLSANPIGDTGASLISEAVKETAVLKTLILHKCGITSRGAENLSRALAQNSSLEKLDIGQNNLGDEGISHVAEALKQNKQLKELWISYCGITDKGAASLASALSLNNSLKMLHMGHCSKEALTQYGHTTIAQSLTNKSEFVKLAIPLPFKSAVSRLSMEVNRARKRNGFLAYLKIEGD